MRPLFVFTGFRKIAEAIPFKLPCGNRAAQLDLAVADRDNLPVAFAGAAIDKNFLTDCKRIRFKYDDIFSSANVFCWIMVNSEWSATQILNKLLTDPQQYFIVPFYYLSGFKPAAGKGNDHALRLYGKNFAC
jgi:hypothetical protein